MDIAYRLAEYAATLKAEDIPAAAGRILGLTPEEMLNAFGIAHSQAAGNYQAITDSSWTKRMQTGFCSRSASRRDWKDLRP